MLPPPPRSTLFPSTTLFRSISASLASAWPSRIPREQWPCRSSRGIRDRSEEHTSELQPLTNLVCRPLLEKKNLRNCHRLVPRATRHGRGGVRHADPLRRRSH